MSGCKSCPDYEQCPRRTWFLDYDPRFCAFRISKEKGGEL